jgi:pyruvate, orthophosphate dikinase
MSRFVYLFSQLDEVEEQLGADRGRVRALLGGKGANLAEMTRLGIAVPPGFTVTTQACTRALSDGGELPDDVWTEVSEALAALERETGSRFGDPEAPLLLSCRSGAPVSMPGMMDTVLNLGLNDALAEAWAARTGDGRFVYDLYRRLVHMFGDVVLGVPHEVFEAALTALRRARDAESDTDLEADDWRQLTATFKELVRTYTRREFPSDPREQLRLAIGAVFRSWNSQRARDYRRAAGIAEDLGTAVNVQTMVYGNVGENSATGICMSRNATTGEPELEGDYLPNAQGEDVVAGVRTTRRLRQLEDEMPEIYRELAETAQTLERHYRNMQDMEFTVQEGTLWILQTRDGKRTAQAEVRIAVDMVSEGLIDQAEAVRRVRPEQVDIFLHPQFDPSALDGATLLAEGLNVSPGAAVGMVALDADTAQRWALEGREVILVRPETRPDDVHGMLAAEGLLTSRGGRTSHAALVARQFGKPAVVGVEAMEIDLEARVIRFPGGTDVLERDWLSLDGTTGRVYEGRLETLIPDLLDPHLHELLSWADGTRTLGIRANADYPADALRAREYGAEGIGLCRTEHMFFEADRLPLIRRMILAETISEQDDAIQALLPLQRGDFEGLFRAMAGLPVIVRLLDPPLHEFLPGYDELVHDLADLKIRAQHAADLATLDQALESIREKQRYLARVEQLREQNPMLGTRGVRLGILVPNLTRMQVRAIFEAACTCTADGVDVHPEIMIPLVADVSELQRQRDVLEAEARAVLDERGQDVPYRFGTMVEVPRAALTAGAIARVAEFFSFGTNDLTQMTFGISRDDAEGGFLIEYQRQGLLTENPFHTLDEAGVGRLMRLAVAEGRASRPDLEIGLCGEHGGDPRSIDLCHRLGLDYVSCSPFRVPVARLAAAHAVLGDG